MSEINSADIFPFIFDLVSSADIVVVLDDNDERNPIDFGRSLLVPDRLKAKKRIGEEEEEKRMREREERNEEKKKVMTRFRSTSFSFFRVLRYIYIYIYI